MPLGRIGCLAEMMPGSLGTAFIAIFFGIILFFLSLGISLIIDGCLYYLLSLCGLENVLRIEGLYIFLGFWTLVLFLFARGIVTPEMLGRWLL